VSELPLIGRGRSADVYDAGDGRVLRRYRTNKAGSVEREAIAMRFLRAHGVPVPEVFEASGVDMVMERLDGPTMLESLKSKPWRAHAVGRTLRELHARIHAVPAHGLDIPRFSDGDAVLHFDLHPDNVMLTASGPVIIDWSNVALGHPLADVMHSWMVMVTSSPENVPLPLRPILQRVRQRLTEGYLGGTPVATDPDARRWLAVVCERRLLDPNVLEHERDQVRALAARYPA